MVNKGRIGWAMWREDEVVQSNAVGRMTSKESARMASLEDELKAWSTRDESARMISLEDKSCQSSPVA